MWKARSPSSLETPSSSARSIVRSAAPIVSSSASVRFEAASAAIPLSIAIRASMSSKAPGPASSPLRRAGGRVRRGGKVVVTAWGPPARCQFLAALMPALGPLMPPPPPGGPPPHPGALSEPGALAGLLSRAGLRVVEEGEVACPFVFPNAAASWLANSSAGVNQAAIAHSGEAAVRDVYHRADRQHMRRDGSIRYENVFLWAAGERP